MEKKKSIFNIFRREAKAEKPAEVKDVERNTNPDPIYSRIPGLLGANGGYMGTPWSLQVYDGEKDLGSSGPLLERIPDIYALKIRGWEGYLTNETIQAVVNKSVLWIIGTGLRLQSDPSSDVLASEGIKISAEQAQKFSDLIEQRFSIYADSLESSLSTMTNLNLASSRAYKEATNGGDVLIILRYINGLVKFEMIDGAHVKSPMGGTDLFPNMLDNGNRIANGVESDPTGRHIAYHVQQADCNYRRIECWSKVTGLRIAYFVNGQPYRLDYSRCLPLFAGLFDIVKSLERYSSATLTSAEEQNKNIYQITHDKNSTGESHLEQNIARSFDARGKTGAIPVDQQLIDTMNKVAASTNKQTVNNVPGAKIEPLNKNEAELYFKDFRGEFFEMICASVNAPPNVIRGKYDTSFSSARASIKDWEHTLIVDRYKYSVEFYRPIYEFWLHMEVLTGKISLTGYLESHAKNNIMALAAFRKAIWIGDNVPHIDPLKEVMAERAKLGPLGEHLPLTTQEAATQAVNGGNARSNNQQFSREDQEAKNLGIKQEPVQPLPPGKKSVDAYYQRILREYMMIEDD